MPDYILKADSFDKQSSKWRKDRTLKSLSATHIMMPKYDGCHCIVNTSTGEVWSRDMKPVRSMDKQAATLTEKFGKCWIIQGEAWHPGRDFPAISGDFRRQQQSDLYFVAYNVLTEEEFAAGYSAVRYGDRLDHAQSCLRGGATVWATEHYPPCTYGDPLVSAQHRKEMGGYDGVILADPEAEWNVGRSRQGELIKVKPNLSLDLRCHDVSVQKGDKTGRDVFVLHVTYNGKSVAVGSGVPHNIYPSDYMDKIVEIEAMGTTPDGSLREPRLKGLRPDKEEPDA